MKKSIRIVCGALTVFCAVLWAGILVASSSIDDRYRVAAGEALALSDYVDVQPMSDVGSIAATAPHETDTHQAVVKLFGVFPIKTVTVQTISQPMVALCGTPFGIKMYIDGVLVVGLSDVATAVGNVGPAGSAGLKLGDVILSINGTPVSTNKQVASLIEQSGGRALRLHVRRDGV